MGYGNSGALKKIKWYTNLPDGAASALEDLGDFFDDESWDDLDDERRRLNFIGAHMWISRGSLAEMFRKKGNGTIGRWIDEWLEGGWVKPANEVKALGGNPTHSNLSHKTSGSQPVHYVLNVNKVYRTLDVMATVNHCDLDSRSDTVSKLLEIAHGDFGGDYEHPYCDSIKKYKPRVIHNFKEVIGNDPPTRWEDLFSPKENSAGEGAGSENTKDLENLSNIHSSTSEVAPAKQESIADILPWTVTYLSDEGETVAHTFTAGHVNDDGELDPALLEISDKARNELIQEASGKIANYNRAHQELLSAYATVMAS